LKIQTNISTKLSLAIAAFAFLASCSSTYEGPTTAHFDGKKFSNPGHKKDSSVGGYLWQRLIGEQAKWPDSVPVTPLPPPPKRVNDGSARVTFIGHATLLIQVGGINILTDPIWSARASPFSFAGPKRVQAPGVSLDDLPTIDVVLISHNHYDHLDIATLKKLNGRDKPRVIVPLGNRSLVAHAMPDSKVSEHDWGDTVSIGKDATISLEPMLHGSGRSPFDQQSSLWAAYVIQASTLKLYYVGDSGYGDGSLFKATGQKYGGFDLAILPIGAYEPVSFMNDSHMTPAEAVKLKADVGARQALAHHYEAFQLGFEAYDAPRQQLQTALAAAKMPEDKFLALKPGQAILVTQTLSKP
jgi:L-ascorbate metabolism protein UlaG (beta-lactamase superfamily)